MRQHPPGPYTYGQCKKMGFVDDKARLVDRPGWFIQADSRRLDLAEVFCSSSQGKAEQEAVARLFAAAPDLLAALKSLLGHATLDLGAPEREITVSNARAAIAKAEGR